MISHEVYASSCDLGYWVFKLHVLDVLSSITGYLCGLTQLQTRFNFRNLISISVLQFMFDTALAIVAAALYLLFMILLVLHYNVPFYYVPGCT